MAPPLSPATVRSVRASLQWLPHHYSRPRLCPYKFTDAPLHILTPTRCFCCFGLTTSHFSRNGILRGRFKQSYGFEERFHCPGFWLMELTILNANQDAEEAFKKTVEVDRLIDKLRDSNPIEEIFQGEQEGQLDEGFLAEVNAQLRQAKGDGDKPGLKAMLQKVLQLYAATVLSKRNHAKKDNYNGHIAFAHDIIFRMHKTQ